MIKITVNKKENAYTGFVSEGHAGYAREGQDIVCAAVSALIITTANAMETLTGDRPEVKEGDGYVSMTFAETLSKEGTLLMDALILGLTQIQDSYGKKFLNIRFKEV